MMLRSILLVDDDELDIISVQRALKKLDIPHRLSVAYNGREALALLADAGEEMPDVILLDLSMPKMNGFEFLEALRDQEQYRSVPVFIMTTSSDSADRKRVEKHNISGYFIKPLAYNNNLKKKDSMDAFVQFYLRKILLDIELK